MKVFRVHPRSVCLNLLTGLDEFETLDSAEQVKVLTALKNTGLDVQRVLADLTRNTIKTVMTQL